MSHNTNDFPKYYQNSGVEFEEDEFGLFTDKTTGETTPVRRFTWRNTNNVSVQVITYGATITSIKIPSKNGYLNPLNPYFGATVGRVANRVGYARIKIEDITYNVSANLGKHQLHGGFKGFDKVNWNHYVSDTKVVLSYLSKDMEEGYPGDVLVNITFELTSTNEFLVDFKATSSKPTFVNLTNHSYFNLAGHNKGAEEMYKHIISINADYTTEVPDKEGLIDDLAIGFNNVEGYTSPKCSYFGATIGRVANRIAGARETIEGITYQLTANDGPNQLHGGFVGFDKVIWESYVNETQVILSYHSADLEEGHPGDVLANVTFELSEDNEILIDFKATTTKPTCKILPVDGTVFDFRVPKVLGDVINNVPKADGYDHNFCIIRGSQQGLAFQAKVDHPDSGRTLEVYSNQPGVQFYTGNALPEDNSILGKDGFIKKHGALCLEPQIYPDAIHHDNFPNVILYPGETYHHTLVYKFIINK
ncbi:hypothetical protein NQ314_014060 [Rhamnusium bicolor]|uniref:Galactose mutarotase n=1 Tax=Rhamnusium bicolor TaxID=1586634 RepID=A0AAV8X487_9CUCU|nr:hypothetical protein NQ314_014060 [Rhamnusium bicolor]